jgi:hypothetical protein
MCDDPLDPKDDYNMGTTFGTGKKPISIFEDCICFAASCGYYRNIDMSGLEAAKTRKLTLRHNGKGWRRVRE